MKKSNRKYPGLCDKCFSHPCKCPPMKKQQQTAWAIFNPYDTLLITTIRKTKNGCIKTFEREMKVDFNVLKITCWTCRKVVIREI